jgi:hypothetical protein
MYDNGNGWFNHDWQEAYKDALKSVEKKKQHKKNKNKYKNINWARVSKLGHTDDYREAGYITPAGKFVDLSGKKEGQMPGMRSYDHREVGGRAGMMEIMAFGYIRIHIGQNYAFIDIMKKPTASQYKALRYIVGNVEGATVEMSKGLGEWNKSGKYYMRHETYDSFESNDDNKILSRIKQYYN